jgi:hypothetical protein
MATQSAVCRVSVRPLVSFDLRRSAEASAGFYLETPSGLDPTAAVGWQNFGGEKSKVSDLYKT